MDRDILCKVKEKARVALLSKKNRLQNQGYCKRQRKPLHTDKRNTPARGFNPN